MSIATKHGDKGQTSLIGGNRVSKSDMRVEAYGTVDELISMLGFARSICEDQELNELTKSIQRELFAVSSGIASPRAAEKDPPDVTQEMVDALTAHVHRIENLEGILSDWSIPGEHPSSAAYDVARTICRRAERDAVRLEESGEKINQFVIPYLNRLSDLLWLFGRYIELKLSLDASLRVGSTKKPWSRAW
jgi:cob(I)alamin adenosyltransferase